MLCSLVARIGGKMRSLEVDREVKLSTYALYHCG